MRNRKVLLRNTTIAGVFAVAIGAFGFPSPALAGDGDAIAFVNGRPISKQKMLDVLMESHGLQILQQMIVLDLAKQETKRRGIRVTAHDVDVEFERAVLRIAPQINAQGQELTEDDRHVVLDRLLLDKGLSLAEFRIGMERNAHLRKLVERDLKVDENTLREEYARVHGEKVEVRYIMVSTTDGLHEALNLLSGGTDFASVARRVSEDTETARNGGLRTPFSFNDEAVAPVLREAAFALKQGERTPPIKVANYWFIMKLERRISPAGKRFEDVREQVADDLRKRVVPERMNQLVAELFAKAEVRVLDRRLKSKFDQLIRDNRLTDTTTKP